MIDETARARFARFVERVLGDARRGGLTDLDIKRLTGIQASTFHKWKTMDGGLPLWGKAEAFCRGLGVDAAEAASALGITDEHMASAASIDRDLRPLAEILAAHTLSVDDEREIRAVLRWLARAAATA